MAVLVISLVKLPQFQNGGPESVKALTDPAIMYFGVKTVF